MAKHRGKPKVRPQDDSKGNEQQRRDENIVDDALKNEQQQDGKSIKCHFGQFKPQDPDWYDNTGMTEAAGHLAFSYPVGNYFNLSGQAAVVPGVMSLDWMPTYGISAQINDALNVAANLLFIKLRSVNSGYGKNYMPADLAMRVMAADNLYIMYQDLMRAYGTITNYAWSTRYEPQYLIEAMGFNYTDLIQQGGPKIQFILQDAAEKLNAFPLPTTFDIIKRHQFLGANYFIDGESDKAQFYVPRVAFIWQYDNTGETGTNMKLVEYHNTLTAQATDKSMGMTLDQWVALFNQVYNAVAIDDDFAIMGGDILKAFGGSEVYKVLIPDVGYKVIPVHNELFLAQITNAFLPDVTSIVNAEINQVVNVNESYITSNITVNVTADYPSAIPDLTTMQNWTHMVFTYIQDPTPMDVVELTRFMPTWTATAATGEGQTGVNLTFSSLGSELLLSGAFMIIAADKTVLPRLMVNVFPVRSFVYMDQGATFAQLQNWLTAMTGLTQFHGYPATRVYARNGATLDFIGFLKNIENYSVIPAGQVAALNQAVLRSLLHVDVPF